MEQQWKGSCQAQSGVVMIGGHDSCVRLVDLDEVEGTPWISAEDIDEVPDD
jgi:hypothetical protein